MLRDAKSDEFFELGRMLFTAQNKKVSFNFPKMNSRGCFTHQSKIQIRFQINVICFRLQIARGTLNCLTD